MKVQMLSCAFLILFFLSNSSILGIDLIFVSAQCLKGQRDLLLEFRSNLTYDPSRSDKLRTWDESVDCCRWGGVECDSRGRVISLDLSSEPISDGIGDSDNSLFRLEFLQSLNLAKTEFDSIQLPSGFGKLVGLRHMNLSGSGFSGQIPLEYTNMTRLVVLDLSVPMYSPTVLLQNPDLKTLIHKYTRLQELYLDGVNISATGYDWCNAVSSSLPALRVLSLPNTQISGPINSSLANLQSLSIINLDGNSLDSPFPHFFADFPRLSVLKMSSCTLSGVVPRELFQIPSIQTIDLTGNEFLEGALPEFHPNGSLENLLLAYSKFSGPIPESIGSLRRLREVYLRNCSFSGQLPNTFTKLTQLVNLDLSQNQLNGSVPSFASLKYLKTINLGQNSLTGRIPDSLWKGLENLDFLNLGWNSLEGEIPASLFCLPSLEILELPNNRFSGSIKDLVNVSLSLGVIDLSDNNLEGPIPRFLFELHNLSGLTLSWNRFNGSLELPYFQKLTQLAALHLSHNNLSIHVNERIPLSSVFPRLNSLMLASCKLQQVPLLRNQSTLMMLDLSDNKLKGEIPNWMWEVGDGSLRFLNLSHNQFTGLQQPYNIQGIDYFDLHSNMLGGQIPLPPRAAVYVELSNNNFSSSLPANIGDFIPRTRLFSIANNKVIGNIPPSLCNASFLEILDLSNNSLHGGIPSCLVKDTLSVLNLRRNNLTGQIPFNIFPVNCDLQTLDLSRNGFGGKIPESLASCQGIEVLNLASNSLQDAFSCWFTNFTKLRIPSLSSNMLYGNISCLGENYTWPNLQILGLASNNLNGVLPSNLFANLKAMAVEDRSQPQLDHLHFVFQPISNIYYQDSVTVTLKGMDVEQEKILTIFTSVDFSNNHFEGAIPQTLGELTSLYVLNLSRNALSGQIPASLGNLKQLESLDLSSNNLSGEIPSQLAGLTFLSFLNLSYNQLTGRIPAGNQFQTFTQESFQGNEGLCGFPLDKSCSDSTAPEAPQPDLEEKQKTLDESEIYISAALGFVVGLGVIFVPLASSKRWRTLYDKHADSFVLSVLHHKQLIRGKGSNFSD